VLSLYGSVISNSIITGTEYSSYVYIAGTGKANEVVAVPGEIMNISAKTVIAEPEVLIL
jgi:hypothetical protein